MPEKVSVVIPWRAQCGESPYWDSSRRSIMWVDIVGRQVLTSAIDDTTRAIDYPEMVGAVAPCAEGGLVLAVESGFAILDVAGTVTDRIDVLRPPNRMNDAKVDPAGRYWAGSCAMDFQVGRGGLWRLDRNLDARLVLDGLTQPNGIGWSPDGTAMYLVETQARELLRFDFDPEESEIVGGPRVIAHGFGGYPDGLAVDADGNIWLAEFAGRAVHQFDPSGTILRSVEIPTAQPTSCAFVGEDLDRLWVTSAAAGLSIEDDPHAGSVFEIGGHGTRGCPVALFKG
ncbi:MAG: SMP-30/gluconolactonase/LRE family protein [Microbacteriaceae bacterium]|nr:MAG: SMP-30/gluconolactonase/LRE family protein [Microbacteriaceae bacterium]